jgi:predicted phosphodiesterase
LSAVYLFCAVSLAPISAAAATLVRGPYLQLLTTTSVTIVWRTNVPAACSVTIGPPGGEQVVVTGATSNLCVIPVTLLAAGTQYGYVPRADGGDLTSRSIFHTDDPSRPYVFLVIGDSGSGDANQLAVRDRMLASPADAIVHTGDMVYERGASADFNPRFFEPYAELLRRLVLWPCLGNHDVKTNRGQPWREVFYTSANITAHSQGYYSFDVGNAHFVVLDSNGDTAPGSAQRTFLDQDLAASTAAWKFVAFHHTIYSSGSTHGSNLPIRRDLTPLFDRYHIAVVFMGHEHNYERTKPLYGDQIVGPGRGTVYVTTGGGGRDLQPVGTSDFTADSESVFHFVRVAVQGDQLALEMIRVDGSTGDSMKLDRGATATTASTSSTTSTTRPAATTRADTVTAS